MKRFAIVLSAALTVTAAGCGDEAKINSPFEKKQIGSATPAAPSSANHFEVKKDGKTYVLSSQDSLRMMNEGQTPNVKEVSLENGKTIYVENASFNDYNRLLAEYKKQHGL